MLEYIRKRDGRIVKFNDDRITRAIFLAASEVAKEEGAVPSYDISEELTQKAIKVLNTKFRDEIPGVEDIQDIVVKVLIEDGHARTSEKYITYRNERSRIRNSRTRLMKSISDITFEDANNANIKRENANIDGNTAMGTMLHYGSAVSKEFCKTFMLKPEHAHAHDNGDIHIHDMDFFNMGTLTCCQIELDKLFEGGFSTGHGFLREPNSIMSYGALAAIAIQSDQNDQHGGQSIPFFDYDMSKGVYKTFRKSYIDNLSKGLELLADKYENEKVREIVYSTEKETGLRVGLKQDQNYTETENKKLIEVFNIDTNIANKIQQFAYNESYKETDRQTYQSMEGFIHNLNTMHSRAGAQVPFSSINFGTDTSLEGRMVSKNLLLSMEKGLGNGETAIFPILIFKVKEGINLNEGDPNYDLFKLSCRVSAKRLFPNFSFLDAPFNLKYYKPNNPETEATYMGCRTRVMSNICGVNEVSGRGNLSFTTINLPRLGIEHGIIKNNTTDLDGFFKDLDDKIYLVIDQLLERMQVQGNKKVKNFPFLMGQGIWRGSDKLSYDDKLQDVIKQGTLTVGFIGLAECLVALIGKHHGESDEARELGVRIVTFMRQYTDKFSQETNLNWSCYATPAEGLSGKFIKKDQKMFGIIKGVTDKEYYTNSYHIPVKFPISIKRKIDIEAPYHKLCNAGHISYIEVDDSPTGEQIMDIINYAYKNTNISYIGINFHIRYCKNCGSSVNSNEKKCPKCSSIDIQGISRVTGYLSLDERFGPGKFEERADRRSHTGSNMNNYGFI